MKSFELHESLFQSIKRQKELGKEREIYGIKCLNEGKKQL